MAMHSVSFDVYSNTKEAMFLQILSKYDIAKHIRTKKRIHLYNRKKNFSPYHTPKK